jgi:hypothetical protein
MPLLPYDQKKMAQAILEKAKVQESPAGEEVPSDSSVGLQAAADSIMGAIDSKDAKMLVSALLDFLQMAGDQEENDESRMMPEEQV